MVDPISDMLNRIRNAQSVSKETVVVPFSKLKFQIAKVLEKEKFIQKTEKKRKKQKKIIEIWLKYKFLSRQDEGGQEIISKTIKKGIINGLRRISKPGKRVYSAAKDVGRFKKGYGATIVSTSKGIRTDKEARRQNLGGEVLFEIW